MHRIEKNAILLVFRKAFVLKVPLGCFALFIDLVLQAFVFSSTAISNPLASKEVLDVVKVQ